jgi:hypothetical protein
LPVSSSSSTSIAIAGANFAFNATRRRFKGPSPKMIEIKKERAIAYELEVEA